MDRVGTLLFRVPNFLKSEIFPTIQLIVIFTIINHLNISTMLKFSDGEVFNTSGPLRTEHRSDGWYVIGKGMLIPVNSEKDGIELIKTLTKPVS